MIKEQQVEIISRCHQCLINYFFAYDFIQASYNFHFYNEISIKLQR